MPASARILTDFELTFYVATQLAARQSIVFHGDEGYIEVLAPFNTGKYDHAKITLHDSNHSSATEYNFSDVNHYRLEVEAFARAAQGRGCDRSSRWKIQSSIRS